MIRRMFATAGVMTLIGSWLAACAAQSSSSSGSSADGGAPSPSSDASAAELVQARPYVAKTSSKYDGRTAVPLVLSLHGYASTAAELDAYFGLSALAEDKNFVLAMPDGTKDRVGSEFWNATDACCNFYDVDVDDVAYLKAVIADMKGRFNVDPKRVYVVGHSNGGFMAHRLACELASEIAAIVSVAGAVYADASRCNPTEPVAVLQVHGDADQTVSYEAGSVFPGRPPFPGAKTTVATWAAKNGCSATLDATSEKLDLDTNLPGSETSVARHACTTGAAELWTIAGGAHEPTFGPSWGPSFYGFLEAHAKR